jgi:hypothetical protein
MGHIEPKTLTISSIQHTKDYLLLNHYTKAQLPEELPSEDPPGDAFLLCFLGGITI